VRLKVTTHPSIQEVGEMDSETLVFAVALFNSSHNERRKHYE